MVKNNVYIDSEHKYAYEEIVFSEWKELRQYFYEGKDSLELMNYGFRGHADSNWPLKPTIERIRPDKIDPIFNAWYLNAEQLSIPFYNRAIDLFSDKENLNIDRSNKLEWLAVMQHYGAATRLLDISSSPFIASYFALSDVYKLCDIDRKNKNICIWAFSLEEFDKKNSELLGIKDGDIYEKTRQIYDHYDFNIVKYDKIIGFSYLEKPIKRSYMQKAGFLFSMDEKSNFEDLLNIYSNNGNICIKKLILKTEFRNDIAHALQDLLNMNISFSALFPGTGIDGYSKDVLLNQFIIHT
jgi:hypothetical protein